MEHEDFDNLLDNLTEAEKNELASLMSNDSTPKKLTLKDLALAEEERIKNGEKEPKLKIFDPHLEKPFQKPKAAEPKKSKPSNFNMEENKQKFAQDDEEIEKLLANLSTEDLKECSDILTDKKETEEKEPVEEKDTWLTANELVTKYKNSDENTLNLTNNTFTYKIGYELFKFIGSSDCKLEKLILANCGIVDTYMDDLGKALAKNQTIKELNIESNQISGDGLQILFQNLLENKTLSVLRMCNQRSIISEAAESKLEELVNTNENLITISYETRQRYMKEKIEKGTMRNRDIQRKKRQQKK